MADEGGVGFWLPGLFGSLAAAPQVPGWSLGMIYIHDSVSASSNVATARAITIGQFNPTLTQSLNASLHATSDIGVISPTYVFATPVLGGQAAVSLAAIYVTAAPTSTERFPARWVPLHSPGPLTSATPGMRLETYSRNLHCAGTPA